MRAPPAPEIAYALYGAVQLLKRDPSGEGYFRTDAEGFWNSFFAAVLVAPGYAILVALHLGSGGPAADWASTFLIHAETYALTWLVYPLVMFYLTAGLQRPERWVPFVVALNWTKVIQLAIYLPMALIAASGVFGPGGSAVATLIGLGAVLYYQWWVTKTILDLPGLTAFGLTGVDLVLGILITSLADAALAG
jgi:hypothetical protein